MKEFNSILYYHAMKNIVYSKSEFFDGINSGFVFVLLIFREILDEFAMFL